MWRTTGDIRNNWDIPDAKEGKCWGGGVIVNLDMQQGLEIYAGPGQWNDPDMLEVGNGALTPAENRAHFSLWCMLAAPLFSGNDIKNMDSEIKEILTNAELIAIDQDPLGKQGFKIKDYGELEIYYKPLQNDEVAICIFNRFNGTVNIELDWNSMLLTAHKEGKSIDLQTNIDRTDIRIEGLYTVRDVWQKKGIGTTDKTLKCEIPEHDVLVYQLTKK